MVEKTFVEAEHLPDGNQAVTLGSFAIVAISAAVVVTLLLVTAIVYKCYIRHMARNAQNRLSSAIKKGLQENTPVKRPLRGSSTLKVTKVTSPISLPEHPSKPSEKLSPGGFLVRPDTMDSAHHIGKLETHIHTENEKGGGETQEKEEGKKIREISIKEKEEPKYLGAINYSVEYHEDTSALLVNVISLTNLPPRNPDEGSCDPYVKLQLLPKKRHKCKTRILKKTLNPVYDETFTFFGIAPNQLHSITLHFVIVCFDRFSRDTILGEVLHPLETTHVCQKKLILCKEITPRHLKFRTQGCGELLISLCHQPAANRLTVVVLKARNLPKMDLSALSDPYVKIYLLYNGQRIAKKKTHMKKRTLNPVFNESFSFDVPCNEGLQNVGLEFLVLDWDSVTKNEVIGRLEIGAKCRGTEFHHWNEVMSCPRKQNAEWHSLTDH